MKHALIAQLSSIRSDLSDFFQSSVVTSRAVSVLLIWLLAWIAYRGVVAVGSRIIAAADDGDEHHLSSNEKRAATVAQLLRSIGRVVLVLVAVLASLDAVGVHIQTFLVSLSFLGAALAFGAQSIVKDILTGLFILIENQFTVGDVVETVGKSGTVEKMTLRVVMLRDLDGTLHIIPNGQMATVSNRTRGWSRAVVDVAVGYDSDIDRALDILRDESLRLANDEAWKARFDDEPEVVGVQSLGDHAVNIRVLLKTQPGMQWEVAREFRRRIKNRLDKEGITVPYPSRTVHIRRHGAEPEDSEIRGIEDAAAGGA